MLDGSYEHQCHSNTATFWAIFVGVKVRRWRREGDKKRTITTQPSPNEASNIQQGLWLVFGSITSVLTRDIIKQLAESTKIAYCVSFTPRRKMNNEN
jgi:hypothetical protein